MSFGVIHCPVHSVVADISENDVLHVVSRSIVKASARLYFVGCIR